VQAVEKQFAALLQVPLPADYKCIGVKRMHGLPGPCALHTEPTVASEKVGLIHPGVYVTVRGQRGSWLFAEESLDARSPAGWVHAGSGGREYLTPVPPEKEYAWQRARGTGVYDSVLLHRKDELSQLNLAEHPNLLKEWHVVIAELDVALRIRAKVDAVGMLLVASVRRPRALSFQSNFFSGKKAVATTPGQTGKKAARKRSNSFASWGPSLSFGGGASAGGAGGRAHGSLAEVPGEDTSIEAVRERWRKLQNKNSKNEWDARTTQRNNVMVSEHRTHGRAKHHVLGRQARDRAGKIDVRNHGGRISKPANWSPTRVAPTSPDPSTWSAMSNSATPASLGEPADEGSPHAGQSSPCEEAESSCNETSDTLRGTGHIDEVSPVSLDHLDDTDHPRPPDADTHASDRITSAEI
jgi:hypothetical protein